MTHKVYLKHLEKDFLTLAIGITVAYVLVRAGAMNYLLAFAETMPVLTSFIIGLFFTSVFTVAPASVALAVLATRLPALDVAFWGACGAVIVDYILYTFIRYDVSRDIAGALRKSLRHRLISLSHFGFTRWVVAFLGAAIIASPLPDELAIALLSFARIKPHQFVLLTFVMNFLGIVLLGLAANAFV